MQASRVFLPQMDHMWHSLHTFRRCMARYPNRSHALSFSRLDQFLAQAFAKMTFRENLCAVSINLGYLGTRGYIARSPPANINEMRDRHRSRHFPLSLVPVARFKWVAGLLSDLETRSMYLIPRRSICRSRCFSKPTFARPRPR